MPTYEPIHRFLEASAERDTQAVALVHGEQRVTYGELEAAANRLANCLREQGVRRGDRIGLLVDNGLDYVAGFFGILKVGGCVVALNSANKARTSQRLIDDAGAMGLVTCLAQARRELPDLVRGCPILRFVVTDRDSPHWELPSDVELLTATTVSSCSEARCPVSVDETDLAAILYTSGSTGMPRGATLTHRNLAANTEQILGYLDLASEDRVLVVLPFHYSFGMSLLLTHVKVGGCCVVDNRFAYPQTILDTMVREEVTGFSGVPSTYAILCAKTDFLQQDFPHLRYLTQAGGAMSPALTRRLREAFSSHITLYVMYGQTEAAARLSYLPPERLLDKLGSIGIPIPGVKLCVRREDGSECEPNEVGEIVAEGDNIMQGYWDDPEETNRVLKQGRLHTGDLGKRDEDGFFYVVDRIKNMIKSGAHRISAKEIEETIEELPGVVEVCVAGLPDELLGEAVVAFVVQRADAPPSEKAILHHCRENLALFKVPRAVTFLPALPKNNAGKVRKADLLKMVGS